MLLRISSNQVGCTLFADIELHLNAYQLLI